MSLNIKNPEAHRLAAELARRTGVSMTEVVTEALREKLRTLMQPEIEQKDQVEKASLIADLTTLAREIRDRVGVEALAVDVDSLLYDDRGLPR